GGAARGHRLSLGSRSGKRQCGSSMTLLIFRPPKSSWALNVLLPANHTSTGQVTTAVTLSSILALLIARIAGPAGWKETSSTTGDGIWPSCRTVTVVFLPDV